MTSFSINLGLPVTPDVHDPELFAEALKIYNALRSLAIGIDDYTGGGNFVVELQLAADQPRSEIAQLRAEVAELRELLTTLGAVNWAQPGAIGETTPNTVAATDLSASGKFGVNGVTPSGPVVLPANATDLASCQTLANALKGVALTFGLGT
jgi:hypothetical protein